MITSHTRRNPTPLVRKVIIDVSEYPYPSHLTPATVEPNTIGCVPFSLRPLRDPAKEEDQAMLALQQDLRGEVPDPEHG